MIFRRGTPRSRQRIPWSQRAPGYWRLVVLLATLVCGAFLSAQDAAPEYQLKAAIISKFPEFAEWPEAALNNRNTIELCVARPSPFGKTFAELVSGQTLTGRALVVRDVGDARGIDNCHLLFVSRLPAAERKEFLGRAAGLPILTVGDYPAFLDEGGIVNLRLVDGRIRFEINIGAATRAGLHLSSQLLELALNVRGGPA